jgi:hypothetical protein
MPSTIYEHQLSIPLFPLPPTSSTVAIPLTIPLEPYLNAEVPVAKRSLDARRGFGLNLATGVHDTGWSSTTTPILETDREPNSTCYRGEPSILAAIHGTSLKKRRLSIRSQLRFESIRL